MRVLTLIFDYFVIISTALAVLSLGGAIFLLFRRRPKNETLLESKISRPTSLANFRASHPDLDENEAFVRWQEELIKWNQQQSPHKQTKSLNLETLGN